MSPRSLILMTILCGCAGEGAAFIEGPDLGTPAPDAGTDSGTLPDTNPCNKPPGTWPICTDDVRSNGTWKCSDGFTCATCTGSSGPVAPCRMKNADGTERVTKDTVFCNQRGSSTDPGPLQCDQVTCAGPTDWPTCPADTASTIPYRSIGGPYAASCSLGSDGLTPVEGCVLMETTATDLGGKPISGPFFCAGKFLAPAVLPGC